MPLGPFEAIVGPEFVRETHGESLDGIPLVGEISPATAEEIAACLRAAAEGGQPLVPCGGGSKLLLGNRPDAKGLVRLSLSRLDATFDLDAEEGVGTASAGVRLERLRSEAAAMGRRTRIDTPHPGATVGGTIATGAFGPALHADRRIRDDLLGVRVALPSGALTRAGGRVVKNVTGYDLVRLQCGAHGTLGVVTESTFRLRPAPEDRRLLARRLSTVDEAFEVAGRLLASGAEPDGSAVRSEEGGALLLWVLEGSEGAVSARASRFEGETADEAAWNELERVLVSPASEGAARLRLMERPSDTSALWARLGSVGGRALVALPGTGIVLGDVPEERAPAAVEGLRRSLAAVVVEQASAVLKERIDVFDPAPDTLPLMRALKVRFDPERILSPGRFVGRI
jgi:glycolate oxidase FAD binding subunit